MGTYSGYTSRQQIRSELTHEGKYASCWVGNHLWIKYPASACAHAIPFIGLALVQRYSLEDWAYKPIDETMGPYQDTCPNKYLDDVPVPPASVVGDRTHEWCVDFRNRCRARNERKRELRQRKKANA